MRRFLSSARRGSVTLMMPRPARDRLPAGLPARCHDGIVYTEQAVPLRTLTRAAATAGARANVWRAESLPGYLRRLSEVRFTAEWLRPYRAGVMPSPWLEDPLARLSAAGRPVLLLHGEKDMTFPAFLAVQAAAGLPQATAVVLPDAGHMAHIDDPAAWLAAVRGFLTADEA
ncbi:MAG TPA: alpha/beta fold hydrolase [Streptosporangiaceae bacterium]|nr:alpha/beta fold hydrolase [Streptosporangiaceae bacterium]